MKIIFFVVCLIFVIHVANTSTLSDTTSNDDVYLTPEAHHEQDFQNRIRLTRECDPGTVGHNTGKGAVGGAIAGALIGLFTSFIPGAIVGAAVGSATGATLAAGTSGLACHI